MLTKTLIQKKILLLDVDLTQFNKLISTYLMRAK